MSGVASAGGGGIFSGLDTASIIEQLMSIESRPKTLIQKRIGQIQTQQIGILDLNSKIQALKSAAETFRLKSTFKLKAATSSDKDTLSATADTNAAVGSFTFLVDRLVSSQQTLSRGFTDRDITGAGASSFTFESARARLDADVALADLNNGAGVARGKITITDSANRAATVDLSRAVTVSDVLEAINGNGVAQVTASVSQGRLVIKDNNSNSAAPTVADAIGYTTATSLGLTTASTTSGGTRTGASVYAMNANTTLNSFNDSTGVQINNVVGTGAFSFIVKVTDGSTTTNVSVNIGEKYEQQGTPPNTTQVKVAAAVSTAGGVITRINEALTAAGATTVSASIDATNGRLVIADSQGTRTLEVIENGPLETNTARDLGILSGPTVGTINGRRVLSGLNSTLVTSLNGGSGVTGDGTLNFTLRNGDTFSASIASATTLDQIMSTIESASTSRVRVSLNDQGTGLKIVDLTGATTSNLIVTGTNGADSAAALGISTGATGIAAATVSGTNLQKRYVTENTLLADNPLKRAVGTGTFRITDSMGLSKTFSVTNSMKTFGDVIELINDGALKAKARINAKGDGIEIYEDNSSTPAGTQKIKVNDESGVVAKNLNFKGEASDVGVSNKIDGSFEKSVTFGVGDTLQQVSEKINAAGIGIAAAVISDGAGATPYRLALSSTLSGRTGRFVVDTGTFDLGLTTLDRGEDAKLFFGSTDAARAVAVTRSSNSFDGLVPGVKLDAKSVSTDPITVSVASNREEMVSTIQTFISTFNTLTGRIDELTKYDAETKKGGALLGDSTAIQLRNTLFQTIQGLPKDVASSFNRFAEIGITVGTGGDLELDEDRLRTALDEDAEGVEALFAARIQNTAEAEEEISEGVTVRNTDTTATFSSLGIMGLIEELSKKYIDSNTGILSVRNKAITDQITAQNARITSLDQRLASKRSKLERQFVQMELAISKLQSQQSALGSLG